MKTSAKLLVLAGLGLFSTLSAPNLAHAQSSAFRRTYSRLKWEKSKLDRKRIELNVRRSSLESRRQSLLREVSRIRSMPAGVGQSAAIRGLKRKISTWKAARDQYNIESTRYKNDVGDYNRRVRSYNRRVRTFSRRRPPRYQYHGPGR